MYLFTYIFTYKLEEQADMQLSFFVPVMIDSASENKRKYYFQKGKKKIA